MSRSSYCLRPSERKPPSFRISILELYATLGSELVESVVEMLTIVDVCREKDNGEKSSHRGGRNWLME